MADGNRALARRVGGGTQMGGLRIFILVWTCVEEQVERAFAEGAGG